jgi:hypothetical protein
MEDKSPVCCDVLTGTSARRDHPNEFMESLKDEEAIVCDSSQSRYMSMRLPGLKPQIEIDARR